MTRSLPKEKDEHDSADIKIYSVRRIFQAVEPFSGTTVSAIGGTEKSHYAELTDESNGSMRLIFSPNEILDCIRPYLPRNLKK